MPYKSEKINISGTSYDRRRKLTEDQKEYIRWLHEEERVSKHKLAEMFNVSRRTIQFTIDRSKYERNRENSKRHKAEGKYKPSKEQWAQVMREHRHYKQQLYIEGKISE